MPVLDTDSKFSLKGQIALYSLSLSSVKVSSLFPTLIDGGHNHENVTMIPFGTKENYKRREVQWNAFCEYNESCTSVLTNKSMAPVNSFPGTSNNRRLNWIPSLPTLDRTFLPRTPCLNPVECCTVLIHCRR